MQSSGNNIVAQRLLYKYKFTLYACSKLYLSIVQSNLCTLFSVYITIKKKKQMPVGRRTFKNQKFRSFGRTTIRNGLNLNYKHRKKSSD